MLYTNWSLANASYCSDPSRVHMLFTNVPMDIAFIEEPKAISRYGLQARIEEMIHRPVDLAVLNECRIRNKIEREGEPWMS